MSAAGGASGAAAAEIGLLAEAMARLEAGFAQLPAAAGDADTAAMRDALLAAAERLHDNYPYHHPLYAGQMLKPPHPVARLAYGLAMTLNPNNHALDGGRASSAMEKEAVADLARMFGMDEHLGHLCGGGTMANFEALWVGRELRPGKAVAASALAHYTHSRLSAVLGVPFRAVPVDKRGRMDVDRLAELLRHADIGTVVVTLGTTAAGTVDPLPEVLGVCRERDVRVHVDAAYGGYFMLSDTLDPPVRRAFDAVADADSVVIDPHKHGLQPYGCGCVIFRDPSVGRFYRHDSPYTYFTSRDLHLGEISLECSRPGAAAVALWTTMRMMPLVRGGALARSLDAGRAAAVALHEALQDDARFAPIMPPSLDIVNWAVRAERSSEASARARAVFEAAAARGLHLAVAAYPRALAEEAEAVSGWDTDTIACLRSCLMKPEHRTWLPEILARLRAAADDVLARRP